MSPTPLLSHLAIIPDGSRRYARAHNLSIPETYSANLDKLIETIAWLKGQGVSHLSAYGASGENVTRRPKAELLGVAAALLNVCNQLEALPSMSVHVFGDLTDLPAWLPGKSQFLALQHTDPKAEFTMHLALNYSGSAEKAALQSPQQTLLSEGVPDVDLLVRTGGQKRLSGFLPFQTQYSELFFTDKLWPEFGLEDLRAVFGWFGEQKRNFGA